MVRREVVLEVILDLDLLAGDRRGGMPWFLLRRGSYCAVVLIVNVGTLSVQEK